MSRFKRCPNPDCRNEAGGGLFGGAYINLHKCKDGGHYFCSECKNGDRCPYCSSANISWDDEQAYTDK